MAEKFADRVRASWAVFRGRAKAMGRKQRSGSIKKRGIDAAKMTGPNRLWSGSKGDANFDVTAGLVKARARSRDAYLNFPYIRQMVDRWVDGLVGNGLRPTPMSGDPKWDDRAWELWQKWEPVAVAGSDMGFYGAERLSMLHVANDGEILIRFRSRRFDDMPGLPPFKIQLVEPDLLPVEKHGTGRYGQIICGVELDGIGEVAAYHMLRRHPGATYQTAGFASSADTVAVPAAEIVHIYDTLRAGQVRGLPLTVPALLTAKQFHEMLDAILTGIESASMLVATVEGDSEDTVKPGINNPDDPAYTGNVVTDATGAVVENLFPGLVSYLPEGKTITFNTAQMPSGVKEIVSTYLHMIAAAGGMSYHTVSGDMSDSSLAQARLGLNKERANLEHKRRFVLVPALSKIYRRFIDECVFAGLLESRPGMYQHSWSDPRVPLADELTDLKAAILKMQAGLVSRADVIESLGDDADVVTAAIAADNALMDDLGIVSIGNPARVTLSGSLQPGVLLDSTLQAPEKNSES